MVYRTEPYSPEHGIRYWWEKEATPEGGVNYFGGWWEPEPDPSTPEGAWWYVCKVYDELNNKDWKDSALQLQQYVRRLKEEHKRAIDMLKSQVCTAQIERDTALSSRDKAETRLKEYETFVDYLKAILKPKPTGEDE